MIKKKKKLQKPGKEVLTTKKHRDQIYLPVLLYITENKMFGWFFFVTFANSSATQNAV